MNLLLWQVTAVTCFANIAYSGITETAVENIDFLQTLKEKSRSKLCPLTNPRISLYVAHPTDCSQFYICENGIPLIRKCQNGLHFNINLKACDYPETAGCDKDAVNKPKGRITDDEFDVCPLKNPRFPIYLPHPDDCSKFYICDSGTPHLKHCQLGLHFNPKIKACDYPRNAGCDASVLDKPKTKITDDDSNECPEKNSKFPVYLPHSDDCGKFYICNSGTPHLKQCQHGLHFNPKLKACDYPENADCDRGVLEKPKVKITDDDSNECPEKNSKFPVYLPHSDDCGKFYICNSGTPHLKQCQRGLHFNPKLKACDYPENAGCDKDIMVKQKGRIGGDDSFKCPEKNSTFQVFFPYPEDCTKFYICDNGLPPSLMKCPLELHFNPKENFCDFPENAGCDKDVSKKPKGKTLDDIFSITCPDETLPGKPVLLSHPSDCDKFYVCDHGKPLLKRCQDGLNFNDKMQACDYPENTVCGIQKSDVFAGVPSPYCPPRNGRYPVFFRHPTNCTVYYMCGNGLAYEFVCPARLSFNLRKKVCDYEDNVNC